MENSGQVVIIIGTGGIASECIAIINNINDYNIENKINIIGCISKERKYNTDSILRVPIIGCDDNLHDILSEFKKIGLIIANATPLIRRNIIENLLKLEISNIYFPNLIHPKAHVYDNRTFTMGEGNIIYAGVTISTNVKIGSFNIINNNITIGHDVDISNYCTINPLASISGNIKIEDNVLIGASSSIKQGVKIGKDSIIGLGAFIVKDVPEKAVMVCKPAVDVNLEVR